MENPAATGVPARGPAEKSAAYVQDLGRLNLPIWDGQSELRVGTLVGMRWKDIRPFVGQPREHFDKDSLFELSESIKDSHGVLQGVHVDLRFENREWVAELSDGERRWRAAQLISDDFVLEAKVVPLLPFDEKYEQSLAKNHGREEHSEYELIKAIGTLLRRGKTSAYIAKKISKSVNWVEKRIAILNLKPEFLEMMKPEVVPDLRMPVGVAEFIAKLTIPQQEDLMKRIDIQGGGAGKVLLSQVKRWFREIAAGDPQLAAALPREQKPGEVFMEIFNLVAHVGQSCDAALNGKAKVLDKAIESQSPAILRKFLEDFDAAAEKLGELREAVAEQIERVAAGGK